MHRKRFVPRAFRISALLVLLIGLLSGGDAFAITCPGGTTLLDVTLTTNARWELCWEVRPAEGVVFHEVHFTPPNHASRRILKEASLGQIHLVYDDGSARRHILTEDGLGGANVVDLVPEQCPNGSLVSNGVKNVLCRTEAGRGYIYKSYSDQRQGVWLELTSLSRTGGLTWMVRWRFYDDGAIEPAVGTTGELEVFGSDPNYGSPIQSSGTVGVGWVASYYWRLDFDIGASGSDDLVERFEVTSTGGGSTKSTAISSITSELAESVDPSLKRSWRVRDLSTTNSDGHFVSYHLEPLQSGQRYVPMSSEAWALHDFAVTVYDPCEHFASQNPTSGGCSPDLAGFIDGESTNGADIVLWYRNSLHHLPRDEDASYLRTRWQGFLLVPRDWTSDSPLSSVDAANRARSALAHVTRLRAAENARDSS